MFGIGLDPCSPQFKGLKLRREGYVRTVQRKLERPGVQVVNLGLIDNPVKALEAGRKFRAADVDVSFLHVTTYALSTTVLPVVETTGGKLKLLVAEGEAGDGPILEIGNPNSALPLQRRRPKVRDRLECARPGASLRGRGKVHRPKD